MLFPIEQLINGREDPVCIRQDQTIREALTIMLEHEFSQLPVVDADGALVGLISDEVITHRYFHLAGEVPLLDLSVDHCLCPAVTLTKDRDIFEALDRLKDVYALVIVAENRPVGILTEFDMAHFFRDLTEDLLIVEDVEVSLRQIVQKVLSEEEDLKKALINALGEDKEHAGEPRTPFEGLTFGQLLSLITHAKNWAHFDDIFQPMDVFQRLMNEVRKNRNQLAHFRGALDPVQQNAVKNAQQWLEARPRLKKAHVAKMQTSDLVQAEASRTRTSSGKYDPIQAYLSARAEEGLTSIRLAFRDLEALLGFELPESARKHRAWWSNEYSTHSHARSWMSAGWLVEDADLNAEQVGFRQTTSAKYPLFFDELLKRIKKERPGIIRAEKASVQNWFSFGAGAAGFAFGWALPKEPVLRVEFYIDTGDRERNKQVFARLLEMKEEIETQIGMKLFWDPLEHAKACRISVTRPFTFSMPAEDQEETKTWGVQTMLKFYETFQRLLQSVNIQMPAA